MPSLLPRRFRGARIPLALTTLCAIAGAAPATWAAPCDPNSSIIYSPAQNTFGTVLFEDSWPSKGDLDFNDEVTAYNYEFQRDSSGNVVTIKATFSILAAGALNHNDLFLHLPTPRTLGSPTIVDQFGHVIAPIASETELVFPILADTRSAFGAAAGAFVNTDPTAAGTTGINLSFTISFASGVPLATAQQPFDLFIARTGNFGWQIHLPQYAGTNAMNTSRFNTVDDASTPGRHFVTSAGLPFGLVIPDQILWPKEFTQISAVYPDISIFAASGGAAATDWYTSTVNTSNAYTTGAGNQAPPSPQMTGADLSCTTISYASSSLICQVGTACSLAAPTHSGGATTFSISPALPGGLTFNTSTGAISGTPGATSPSGSYTVTGINGAGAATAVLTVEIDAAPAGNTFAPSLAMGSGDACAILNGNVYCWGQNYYGALGNGGPASATPTQVAGLPGPAQSVSLGYYSSCAVVNGAAW
ncbi:MAG: LruC domain-containing protein, partial [Deltaproteobacteria bacterium]|nr:LruC domain-containing protein [Deltaproteobacteria bacterium]